MSAGWSILVLGVERFGVVVSKFGRHVELAGFEIVAHVPAARKELVIDRRQCREPITLIFRPMIFASSGHCGPNAQLFGASC